MASNSGEGNGPQCFGKERIKSLVGSGRLRVPRCSEMKSKGTRTSNFWKGKGSKDPYLGMAGVGPGRGVSGLEEDAGILSSLLELGLEVCAFQLWDRRGSSTL